ncbi:MAG: hypothetical protein OHK0048_03640 [Rhodoferax sp.]
MDFKALQTPNLISPDDAAADLAALRVQSLGWLPLDAHAYLHWGNEHSESITVVGLPRTDQSGDNLLWLLS